MRSRQPPSTGVNQTGPGGGDEARKLHRHRELGDEDTPMADAKHTAELDVTSSKRPMELKPHPDDATNRDSRDNKKITPQPEARSNQQAVTKLREEATDSGRRSHS